MSKPAATPKLNYYCQFTKMKMKEFKKNGVKLGASQGIKMVSQLWS